MASAPKKIWQDSYQLYIGGEWREVLSKIVDE